MLLENRPNIVVDDNYKMFVQEMKRRYAERGAVVYTDKDAIEQERRDAHARNMAPDAYRMSSGIAASRTPSGQNFMTTEEYLKYFGKCHDTFDAVNYQALHKEPGNASEDKILVNRRIIAKIRHENVATERRMPEKQAPEKMISLSDMLSEFVSGMSQKSRRLATGMAAVAASLAIMIGGVAVFSTPDTDADYVRAHSEAQVVEADEIENVIQR